MRHLPLLLFLSLLFSCRPFAHYNEAELSTSTAQRAREQLSVQQRRQFDKCYLEAIRQKHKGNEDAAFELLDAALRINPHASEALYEQGLLLLSLPFQDDSLLRLRGEQQLLLAYQLEPKNTDYRQTLAYHYIQTKRYARAARLYEQMAKEHPSSETLDVLFKLYQQTENYATAMATLDRLEALNGRSEESCLRRYALYKSMGKASQAYQAIWNLCEEHPLEPRYRIIMGDLYLQNGYPEAALSLYGDVLTSDSSNTMARSSLLNYYYMVDSTEAFHRHMQQLMLDSSLATQQKLGLLAHYSREAVEQRVDKERMLQHFLQALQQPQSDEQMGQMAAAFIEAAKLPKDSLIPVMQAVLRDDPANERSRLQLLQIMVKQGRVREMAQLCAEGIELQPQQVLYYYFGGLGQMELANKGAALDLVRRGTQLLESGVEGDTLVAAGLYAVLGDLEHHFGRSSLAFAAYERCLSYDPDQVGVLNNYAYFLSLSGKQLHKALRMSSRCLELEADNPTFLDTHAWVLYKLRRYPQARQFIAQCLRQIESERAPTPADTNLYDHAGDIYYRCGQVAKALEHWKKAEALTTDKKERTVLQRKIRRKRP